MIENSAMDETMAAIFGPSFKDKKDGLLHDIAGLEKEIQAAQTLADQSNELTEYRSTISPMLANERHRAVVFLKKDLENKKHAYQKLLTDID
jgi:hypothetical protein